MWVMYTVYNILHILLGPYERGTTERPYRIWFGLVWGGGRGRFYQLHGEKATCGQSVSQATGRQDLLTDLSNLDDEPKGTESREKLVM